MTRRQFTPAQDQQLAREYAEGRNFRELAEIHGGTEVSVRNAVHRAGGSTRPRSSALRSRKGTSRQFGTADARNKLRAKYESGILVKTLAATYDCSPSTITLAIRRAGGQTRQGRPSLWTPELTARVIQEYSEGRDLDELADAAKVTRAALRAKLRRHGVLPPAPTARREAHGQWKGGRQQISGYWYVKPAPEDLPFCVPNSRDYVAEHRLVMGRHLGRPLDPSESVHHKNGDRADNRLENLQLRQGKHGKGSRWVCRSCGSDDIASKEI